MERYTETLNLPHWPSNLRETASLREFKLFTLINYWNASDHLFTNRPHIDGETITFVFFIHLQML